MSEVIDIFPGNLDSGLCSSSPAFCMMYPVHCFMSNSDCCFLTCIQISQEAGKVVWYSHFFKNFAQFVVIHIVKGFSLTSEAEVDF